MEIHTPSKYERTGHISSKAFLFDWALLAEKASQLDSRM